MIYLKSFAVGLGASLLSLIGYLVYMIAFVSFSGRQSGGMEVGIDWISVFSQSGPWLIAFLAFAVGFLLTLRLASH